MTAGLARDGGAGESPASLDAGQGTHQMHERIGRYRLVQQLGEGGMGVVHLAVDENGRAVAIKVLRDHVAGDADARARLDREVATLARVQDPRVAAVLDADTVGSRPYIVTRYVPGPPLDRVVLQHGALDTAALLRLGRGLSGALQAIHAAGVVHRDLKPGNVLLLDGDPVVIDFGIAHVADDIRLTMTGLVMGTPGYLSPEVVQGAPVTEATDWWGWAATLAFAAKGAPPFGRGPMDVVLDRVRRGHADLTDVDARLVPLLHAALSPDSRERPHAEEIMQALERYAAGGQATVAVPTTTQVAPTTPIHAPRTSRWPVEQAPTGQPDGSAGWPPPSGGSEGWAFDGGHDDSWAADGGRHVSRAADGASADGAVGGWPPAPGAAPMPAAPPAYGRVDRLPMGRDDAVQGIDPGSVQEQESDWQAAWSGPPHADPRIGRELRRGTLFAALLAIVALTAVWPTVAAGAVVLLTWTARFADRTLTSLVMRRHERGPRRADVPLAVVLSPWHLITSAVAAVMGLLLPVLVLLAMTFSVALGVAAATGRPVEADGSLPVSAGMMAALLTAWWGPGGASLRRGSRSLVRGISPGRRAREVLAIALLLLAGGLGAWAYLRGWQVDWWPWTRAALPSFLQIGRP